MLDPFDRSLGHGEDVPYRGGHLRTNAVTGDEDNLVHFHTANSPRTVCFFIERVPKRPSFVKS
jgi:hypothetical protein